MIFLDIFTKTHTALTYVLGIIMLFTLSSTIPRIRNFYIPILYKILKTYYTMCTHNLDFKKELFSTLKNPFKSQFLVRDRNHYNKIKEYVNDIKFKNIWSTIIYNPNISIGYVITFFSFFVTATLYEGNSTSESTAPNTILQIVIITILISSIITPILFLNYYFRKHILAMPLEEYTRSINAILTEKELHVFISTKIHRIANSSIQKGKQIDPQLFIKIKELRENSEYASDTETVSQAYKLGLLILEKYPSNLLFRNKRHRLYPKWLQDTFSGNYNFEEQNEGGLNTQIEILRIKNLIDSLEKRANINQKLYCENFIQFSPELYKFWNEKFHRNLFLMYESALEIPRPLNYDNENQNSEMPTDETSINHLRNIARCAFEIADFIRRMEKINLYSIQNIAYYDLADEILETYSSKSSSAIRGYFLTCLNKIINERRRGPIPLNKKHKLSSRKLNNHAYYICKSFYLERKLRYHNFCSVNHLIKSINKSTNNSSDSQLIIRFEELRLIYSDYLDGFLGKDQMKIKNGKIPDDSVNTLKRVHDIIFNGIKNSREAMFRSVINHFEYLNLSDHPHNFLTWGYSRSVREIIFRIHKKYNKGNLRFFILESANEDALYMKYHLDQRDVKLNIISVDNYEQLFKDDRTTILLGGEAYFTKGKNTWVIKNNSERKYDTLLLNNQFNHKPLVYYCIAEYKKIESVDFNNDNFTNLGASINVNLVSNSSKILDA